MPPQSRRGCLGRSGRISLPPLREKASLRLEPREKERAPARREEAPVRRTLRMELVRLERMDQAQKKTRNLGRKPPRTPRRPVARSMPDRGQAVPPGKRPKKWPKRACLGLKQRSGKILRNKGKEQTLRQRRRPHHQPGKPGGR